MLRGLAVRTVIASGHVERCQTHAISNRVEYQGDSPSSSHPWTPSPPHLSRRLIHLTPIPPHLASILLYNYGCTSSISFVLAWGYIWKEVSLRNMQLWQIACRSHCVARLPWRRRVIGICLIPFCAGAGEVPKVSLYSSCTMFWMTWLLNSLSKQISKACIEKIVGMCPSPFKA